MGTSRVATRRVLDCEQIVERLRQRFGADCVEWLANESPSGQGSILVKNKGVILDLCVFLRDEPGLQLDYLSNVTGVDWLDSVEKIKRKTVAVDEGEEKEVTVTEEVTTPGFLEAVYHLYSIENAFGPVVIRLRTEDRKQKTMLPSLTPIWRSAELQEREIFDLYGIRFEGHPDLRRLLMWEEFEGHPMRKDFVEPDDYEYEPTPHDEVLEKAKGHYPMDRKEGGA